MSFKSVKTKQKELSIQQLRPSLTSSHENNTNFSCSLIYNDLHSSQKFVMKSYNIKMELQQQNQKQGDLDMTLFEIPKSANDTNYGESLEVSENQKSDEDDKQQDINENQKFDNYISPSAQQNNCLTADIDNSSIFNKNELYNNKGSNPNLSKFMQFKQRGRQQSIWMANASNQDENKQYTFTDTKRKTTYLENNDFSEKVQNPKTIWQKSWTRIIFIIYKIKKIALQTSIFFHPHLLNKTQVNLIGDKASNSQYTKSQLYKGKYELGEQYQYIRFSKYVTFRNYRKIVKFILKYFGWLFFLIPKIEQFYSAALHLVFQYFPLFHYLSGFYMIWETIIFLCTALLFLYIPFEFSFEINRSYFFSLYFSLVCPIVFGTDIFIRANTRSTENGGFIENHIIIFHKYLKSDLIPDIVSLLSLNYEFFGLSSSQFIFFIRIVKSFRVIHLFREQFLLKIRISGMISLMILLAQLLYFAHIVCCFWYGLGKHESKFNIGWISKYDLENQTIEIQYLRSFYYSVITMTTIGYGDITPQTDYEKMIVIFIAFISCGVFGYSINSIGNILSDFKTRNDIYLQEIAKLNKYFKQYKVDLDLQARSRQYLDIIYSDKKEEMISSIDTLSNLSDYLQNEIKVNVFMKRMKEVKFFNDTFPNEILEQIALKMKEQIYSPEQNIIDSNEVQEPMIYIVHSGAVKKYATKSENKNIKEIKTLYEGQIFGFDKFVKGSYESDFNYKSHGISSVIQVTLGQFIEIIKKNEEIHEKFLYYKDQLLYNQNYGVTNLSCDSCMQKFHDLQSCPFVFYQGKKEIIMRNYFKEIDNRIKNFKRLLPKICFNSVFQQKDIEKSIEIYCKNNLDISDEEDDPNSLLLEEEGGEEDDDKTYDNQNSSNRDESSIQKAFDKISHKELSTSYKQIYYEDQINNIITNQQKPDRMQNKQSYFLYSKSPLKISQTDDGLTGADTELSKNQRMSVLNNLNQPQSSTDIQNQKASSHEHEGGGSLKKIDVIKNIKKPEYISQQSLINMVRRLSSLNDQQSLIKKLEPAYDYPQSRKSFQLDPREQRNSQRNSKLQQLFQHQLSQLQEKSLHIDKSLHQTQGDKTTLVVDKSNLSQFFHQPQVAIDQQNNHQLFLYSFDTIKVFQYYFPNQNYEQIIDKINQKQKASRKRQIRSNKKQN